MWKKISKHQVRDETVIRLYQESKDMLCWILSSTHCRFGLTCDSWKFFKIIIFVLHVSGDWFKLNFIKKNLIGFKNG